MDLRVIDEKQKNQYEKAVTHVIQSWEWGEFRKKLGIPLLRYGIYKKGKLVCAFSLSLHKIPFTKYFVGYLPKGPLPNKDLAEALNEIGRSQNCAFIKVEPNILSSVKPFSIYPKFLPSPKPLFTKNNFLIDLTQSEEKLLGNLHSKTRYNIRLAQRKGVKVKIGSDDKSFEDYLKLYFETTTRQGYHGHNRQYHRTLWQILKKEKMATILIGYFKNKPLSAWMLLNFKNTLYYPYGGSSTEYKEVMANNLVAWEAILLGKKMGCKSFDLWGALGENPNTHDPWYGFHRFKAGYGAKLVEYIGSYDLVFKPSLYFIFTSIDKMTSLKIILLKLLGKKID